LTVGYFDNDNYTTSQLATKHFTEILSGYTQACNVPTNGKLSDLNTLTMMTLVLEFE